MTISAASVVVLDSLSVRSASNAARRRDGRDSAGSFRVPVKGCRSEPARLSIVARYYPFNLCDLVRNAWYANIGD
jgi:hypothetical protein